MKKSFTQEMFDELTPENHFRPLLSVDEIKEIIVALEAKNGRETELGNDLKLVLAGKL